MRTFWHADCGTELTPLGSCPACGSLVAVRDIDMRPGPGLDPDPADPVSRALLGPRRLLQPVEAE